jgi:hypothetical protein
MLLACTCLSLAAASFTPSVRVVPRHVRAASPLCAAKAPPPPDLEEVTEKYGLEAGLFSALRRSGGSGSASDADGDADSKAGAMATAGDLLKRYGGAYLLTSTSLAVVSFSLCYWAVSNGVDVSSLLQRVGIEVSTPRL